MKKAYILLALCNIIFLSCSDNSPAPPPPLPTHLASPIDLFQLYTRASTRDEENYEDTYTGEIHEGIILINIPEELDQLTELRSRPMFFVPQKDLINTEPGYNGLVTLEEHPDGLLSFGLRVTEAGSLPRDYEVRLIRQPSIKTEEGNEYTSIFGKKDFDRRIGSLARNYILMNSITLSQEREPIGSEYSPFTGIFEGNGKILSSVSMETNIKGSSYTGLFARIGLNGVVRNLSLVDFIVDATDDYAGTLTGRNEGLIDNVQVKSALTEARISGEDHVGGLVGWNDGEIRNSTVDSSVKGASEVGGLVGRNNTALGEDFPSGEIINSHYEGKRVRGTDSKIGGLVGANQHGNIENSHAYTLVTFFIHNNLDNIGGLVGYSYYGSITNSYAKGTVIGRENVGGLVGLQVRGKIINSYSQATATGNRNIGGLIGSQSLTYYIKYSYASGATAMYSHPTREGNRGSLIGNIADSANTHITFTYYDGSGFRHPVGNSSDPDPIDGLEAFYAIYGYAYIENNVDSPVITEQDFSDWNFDTIWHWVEDGRWPILRWQEEAR